MTEKQKLEPCLIPTCDASTGSPTARRGLCSSHYQSLQARVKAGEYTWYELEKHGFAKPPMARVTERAAQLEYALGELNKKLGRVKK